MAKKGEKNPKGSTGRRKLYENKAVVVAVRVDPILKSWLKGIASGLGIPLSRATANILEEVRKTKDKG